MTDDHTISPEQIAAIFRLLQNTQDRARDLTENCQYGLLSHYKQNQVAHWEGMETGINSVMYILDIDRKI